MILSSNLFIHVFYLVLHDDVFSIRMGTLRVMLHCLESKIVAY